MFKLKSKLGNIKNNNFNMNSYSPALWLDATDINTITLVNGKVSQWNDKSGNERHATQLNAPIRPTYNSSCLVFDNSVGVRLDISTTISLTEESVFVVLKRSGAAGPENPRIFAQKGTLDSDDWKTYIPLAFNGYQTNSVVSYGTLGSIIGTLPSIPDETKVLLNSDVGNSLNNRINGGNPANSAFTINYTINNITIAGRLSGSSTDSFNGSIYEIIMFTRSLSTVERQKIEQYLINKHLISI